LDKYDIMDGVQYVDTPVAHTFRWPLSPYRSTLDIGVLGYIGIVWPNEHSPEVSHIPPVTLCIYTYTYGIKLDRINALVVPQRQENHRRKQLNP